MKKVIILVTLILLFGVGIIGGGSISLAQGDNQPPIILSFGGDLWAYYELADEFVQLTTGGYNGHPALSPDGQTLAYSSTAEFAVVARESGDPPAFTDLPSNIWLWHTPTGDARRLADQPTDASLEPDGAAVYRGDPAWSPDGSMIAWTQMVRPGWTWQLVVYDTTTNVEQILVTDLPSPYADAGHYGRIPIQWSNAGLAVSSVHYDPELSDFVREFQVYDAEGTLLSSAKLPLEDAERLHGWRWVWHDGQYMLGLLYSEQGWRALDPQTGLLGGFSLPPEHHSVTWHEESYSFALARHAGRFEWYVLELGPYITTWQPPGMPIVAVDEIGNINLDRVALSPGGEGVALLDDALYIWWGDEVRRVHATEIAGEDPNAAVIWGPAAWSVRPFLEISAYYLEPVR